MDTKIILASFFGGSRSTVTAERTTVDYGQILHISEGITLPETFEAFFCNEGDAKTKKQIGNNNCVPVPDEFIADGRPVMCYIFLHDGADDGRVMYTIKIPIVRCPESPDIEPTPVQQDVITQAINALNNAGDSASQSASEAQTYAERAETASESAQASQESATQSATASQQSAESASQSAQEAAQSATDASESEARAKRYAQDAEVDANRAEMAAHTAGFFWLETDANDDLIFIRTDNAPVNIYADENDDLIVEAF